MTLVDPPSGIESGPRDIIEVAGTYLSPEFNPTSPRGMFTRTVNSPPSSTTRRSGCCQQRSCLSDFSASNQKFKGDHQRTIRHSPDCASWSTGLTHTFSGCTFLFQKCERPCKCTTGYFLSGSKSILIHG